VVKEPIQSAGDVERDLFICRRKFVHPVDLEKLAKLKPITGKKIDKKNF